MRVSISLHVFVLITMTMDTISSFAGDLTKASNGIYYAGTRGCDDASETATLIFDGVDPSLICGDLAPNFYPALSLLRRLIMPCWAGCAMASPS